MENITQDEFNKIYEEHQLWLNSNGSNGKRANLSDTDLTDIILPERPDFRRIIAERADFRELNLNLAKFNLAKLSESDFRRVSLRKAFFYKTDISNVNFTGAYLYGIRLRRSIAKNSIFKCTDLTDADLTESNFDSANFTDANLTGANLTNANFFNADFTNTTLPQDSLSQPKSQIIDKYQQKINDLEKDKIYLLSSNENKEKELKEKTDQISKLQTEQKRIKEEQEKAKEEFAKKKEEELNNAFGLLEGANSDIEKEIIRLNRMFNGYIVSVISLIILLISVWVIFYTKLCDGDFDNKKYLSTWMYISPSLLLVAFIWGAIVQAHRAQRQLVALRKYTHKIKQIKAVLQAYIKVIDDPQEAKNKINEVLSSFTNHLIDEDISLDTEENSIRDNEKKDNVPYRQAFDAITEIIKNYKS